MFKKLRCKLKSSDENIVKVVDFGNERDGLEAIKEGTVNVKLSFPKSKETLTCKVTVKYAELFSIVGTKVYSGYTYNMEMKGNVTSGTQFRSSDEKIATVSQDGVVKTLTTGKVTISCVGDDGIIASIGVGKCTITCTAKDGKIYKCALTVEGGKPWGGFYNGYKITKSKFKTTPLYKKLNKVYDYGDQISVVYSMNRETGVTDIKDKEIEANVESWVYYELLLMNRYPNREVYTSGGDFLFVKNDDGSPYRFIRFTTYYVR